MKFIKDLGVKDFGTYKKRMCIMQCRGCGIDSEKAYSYARLAKDRVCKSCAVTARHKELGNGMKHKRLYSIYSNMKTRCYNKNNSHAKNYCERGIIICDGWLNDYKSFESWSLANGYDDSLSIDRINNDGNYEPSNCRWATNATQAKNTQILRVDNKTGYRGVVIADGKYLAQITVDGKRFNLGRYITAIEAGEAYDIFVTENSLGHTLNFKETI